VKPRSYALKLLFSAQSDRSNPPNGASGYATHTK